MCVSFVCIETSMQVMCDNNDATDKIYPTLSVFGLKLLPSVSLISNLKCLL